MPRASRSARDTASSWTCMMGNLVLFFAAVVRRAVTRHVLDQEGLQRALQLGRHLPGQLVPAEHARRLVGAYEGDAGRTSRQVGFERRCPLRRKRSIHVLAE